MRELSDTANRQRQPLFTVAAWVSLIIPLLGFVLGYAASAAPRGIPVPVLVVLSVAAGVSFVAGCASLAGVRANGAPAILPPALLGLLASALLELLALMFLVLSHLPGP